MEASTDITPNVVNDRQTGNNRPRRAVVAALLSVLFMGLGQFYNRQYVKGGLMFLLELYVLVVWSRPFMKAMWGLYTLGETVQQRVRGRVVRAGRSFDLSDDPGDYLCIAVSDVCMDLRFKRAGCL